MRKRIGFKYKKKKFEFDVKVCNSFEKLFGLMFKERENAKTLLFDFKNPTELKISSLFVFFPFVAVWLDKENTVIELKTIKPFTLSTSTKKPFHKLIEIPINKKNNKVIKLLVGD